MRNSAFHLFTVVSICATWLRIYSAVILNKSHLEDMCYVDRDRLIEPVKRKNTTGLCSAWQRTCCSATDVEEINRGKRINFHPCHNRQMSSKCQRHFERKLCFQNCSPYVGPWLLNLNASRSRTRFRYAPLCRSQCEQWWENCKHDWAKQENWYPGRNGKFEEAFCQTIEEKYNDSTYFCEHAFDEFEFLVVPDYEPCLSLFGDLFNNRFVSMTYAESALQKMKNIDFSDKTQYPPQSQSPPTKFLILCFFLGGIIAAVGFVLGCILLSRCRSNGRRNNSQAFLFQNQDDVELVDSEETSI